MYTDTVVFVMSGFGSSLGIGRHTGCGTSTRIAHVLAGAKFDLIAGKGFLLLEYGHTAFFRGMINENTKVRCNQEH